MNTKKQFINFEKIEDMLDNDPEYFQEFCEAAYVSFERYRDEYHQAMLNRDLSALKKTGHRIKPVVQMLGIHKILEQYEADKKLLKENASLDELKTASKNMQSMCNQILAEFRKKID